MQASKPQDLAGYRRQVMYRCGHIGTKELELVLTQYLHVFANGWTYKELEAFENEIMSMENPQLVKYLMNGDPVMDKHKTNHMDKLLDYVEKRKTGEIKRPEMML